MELFWGDVSDNANNERFKAVDFNSPREGPLREGNEAMVFY